MSALLPCLTWLLSSGKSALLVAASWIGVVQGGPRLAVGAPFLEMARPPAALVAEEPIDLPLVSEEIERHEGALAGCYARGLAAHPDLKGTVILHWTVATDGSVADQCVTVDSLHDADVLSCVNEALKGARFPAPAARRAVDVSVPFYFGLPPRPGC